VLAQDLTSACGADPSYICREVLDRTHSTWLASTADVLFAKPLEVGIILVVAAVINWLVRRAITRFVGAMAGNPQPVRRAKRRLRRTRVANVLPSGVLDTGALSLRAAARAETLGLVLRSLASFAIWGIAFVTVLGQIGVKLGPLVAGAGVAGVAIGFGAQSLVKDFLAGIFILVEDQYGVGDIIDAGEATGTVEAVSLRTTKLRDVNGTVWHLPNGGILRVGNKSQQWARALLDIVVSYGSDLDLAQRVIKEVADELWRDPAWSGQVLEEPEVWGVEDLGPAGITLRLVVKTQPARQFTVMRELRQRLTQALDAAGVEMPPAPQTVWVRRDAGRSTEAGGPGVQLSQEVVPPPAKKATRARKTAKKRS
jgi:small conductance mechanosensitive channel